VHDLIAQSCSRITPRFVGDDWLRMSVMRCVSQALSVTECRAPTADDLVARLWFTLELWRFKQTGDVYSVVSTIATIPSSRNSDMRDLHFLAGCVIALFASSLIAQDTSIDGSAKGDASTAGQVSIKLTEVAASRSVNAPRA